VCDYPISISVSDERRTVHSLAGRRAAERIRPHLKELNIMRVDRIEPTKNIVLGIQAYNLLLENHPELHGKVTFLAFLVPSRETLSIYRKYKDEILKLVEEINQKYGKRDWTPIQPFVQNDRTLALAALQYYDALLVNPLIDGMNLVAKEGPIVNKNNGVLLLSRTSGAFQQMEQGCLPLSPRSPEETAEKLYQALTLSKEERGELAKRAREEVEQNDLQAWIQQQVHDINQLM
jgi:trehalose 6-phosphate synthase